LWIGLAVIASAALSIVAFVVFFYFYLLYRFRDFVVRVFEERPLFVIPRGQPIPEAEDVRFPTADGLMLSGCYLRTPSPRRDGVILFGLEFGSNRWACYPYCEFLLQNGFDVFSFESRGQGDSDEQPGYTPLQWVTDCEVNDVWAALAYLQSRPDSDPRGVAFFGISKGGSAGLIAGSRVPYIRCFAADGVFATRTTMVPYMRKWVAIVSSQYFIQRALPVWFYGALANACLRYIRRQRGRRFPHLEHAMTRLAPRPLLMIHGGADTYIKPQMAEALFRRAQPPKELWVVPGAKHNQALHVAGDEYRQKVLKFFKTHLAPSSDAVPQQLAAVPDFRTGDQDNGKAVGTAADVHRLPEKR
jgi:fermentation-respiration switch protein FrsA (DUF1100 family)